MPRPQRKRPKLTEQSLEELLGIIWNEADELRIKATYQYNKQNRDVKDNADIAAVGKTNNELLKIIDGAMDKRIQVARLVKDYVTNKSIPATDSIISGGLVSEDAKDKIFELIEKANEKSNSEYVNKESNSETEF